MVISPSSVWIGSSREKASWPCRDLICFNRFFDRFKVIVVSQVVNFASPRNVLMFL